MAAGGGRTESSQTNCGSRTRGGAEVHGNRKRVEAGPARPRSRAAVLEIIEAKVARGDQAAASANVEIALRRSTAVLFAIGTELRGRRARSLPSSR